MAYNLGKSRTQHWDLLHFRHSVCRVTDHQALWRASVMPIVVISGTSELPQLDRIQGC